MASRITSLHQIVKTEITSVRPRANRSKPSLKQWKNITKPTGSVKQPILQSKGQGEYSTKWNECRQRSII
jgi:hypothetical protein